MLLLLTDYLTRFHGGFSVFQFLTLRAILGVLTALAVSLVVGPAMIRHLSTYQIGQTVRNDGPESHFTKSGTPTMGGALILVAIATTTLFWADLSNRFVWVVLIVTLLFGAVGWVDRTGMGHAGGVRYLLRSESRGRILPVMRCPMGWVGDRRIPRIALAMASSCWLSASGGWTESYEKKRCEKTSSAYR